MVKIYFDKNGRHPPNPVTGNVGTPFRVINDIEGKLVCEYQLKYLDLWQDWFTTHPNNKHISTTNLWFSQIGILPRQKGFQQLGTKYTCEQVFDDCRAKCKEYLANQSRYTYLAEPVFTKVDKAISKGIDVIIKREFPYPEVADKLLNMLSATRVEWIEGSRPKLLFNTHFTIEESIKEHDYGEADEDDDTRLDRKGSAIIDSLQAAGFKPSRTVDELSKGIDVIYVDKAIDRWTK